MLIQLEGKMVKDIEYYINKDDPKQVEIYEESICWEELEWLLENNIGRNFINYRYTLEVEDDSKGCGSESKCF